MARARAAASTCRHGVSGSFFATVHVRPDGRVSAAGIAPPSERGEDVADCVVDAIRKLRFQPMAPRAAKVSFELRSRAPQGWPPRRYFHVSGIALYRGQV